MVTRIAVVSLLAMGCSTKPSGMVLLFPSATDQQAAIKASIQIIDPKADGALTCPSLVTFPPPEPIASTVRRSVTVALNNGVASSNVGSVPLGSQTILVKVENAGGLFLIGCKTENVRVGRGIEIELGYATPQDMATPIDLSPDTAPPPDLQQPRSLTVNVTEVRAPNRKLAGVGVLVSDSTTLSATATTDVMGAAVLDVTSFTPPLRITASAPLTNTYLGATTLAGLSPTFVADKSTVLVPIELDPPTLDGSKTLSVQITNGVGDYEVYWQGSTSQPGDFASGTFTGTTAFSVGPLDGAQNYRLVVMNAAHDKGLSSPFPITPGAAPFTRMESDFVPFATDLKVTLTPSANVAFTENRWGVSLVSPAASAILVAPIKASTAFATAGMQPDVKVPTMAATILTGTLVQTYMVATGASARSELRHNLAATTPTVDVFNVAVHAPPVVTAPAMTPAANTFDIAATPPAGLQLTNAFVHVTIKDGTDKTRAHLFAAAANPTTITVPAALLPAGMYTASVAFVINFSLPDGTVNATLLDDWTKLIRVLPQTLTESTVAIELQ